MPWKLKYSMENYLKGEQGNYSTPLEPIFSFINECIQFQNPIIILINK